MARHLLAVSTLLTSLGVGGLSVFASGGCTGGGGGGDIGGGPTSGTLAEAGASSGSVGSCIDGAKNGSETDVDCGGSCPTKCAGAKACAGDADCASGRCAGSVCDSPPVPELAWGGTASHACARSPAGQVKCWGFNKDGQLGDGTTENRSTPTGPILLGEGRTAKAVAASQYLTCALLDDGSVKCWGLVGSSGLVGDGTTNTPPRTAPGAPVLLGAGRTALAISLGSSFGCVLLDDHSVKCWGTNRYGELGDGTKKDASTPVAVVLPGPAVAIGTGASHACAILEDRTLRCWGSNQFGALGIGSTTDSAVPASAVDLGPGRVAVEVVGGGYHTCARLDDGTMKCWGANLRGELGVGTNTSTSAPGAAVALGAGRTAVKIMAAGYDSYALLDDGTVKGWGDGADGMLAHPKLEDANAPGEPMAFGPGRKVLSLSPGAGHVCAVLDDALLRCWGYNNSGVAGDGTLVTKFVPGAPVVLGF